MDTTKLKKHLPYILIIVAIALLIYHPFLDFSASRHRADYRISHQNTIFIMDKALSEGTLPLWTSQVDAGMPFYAIPDKPFFYPPMLFFLLFLGPVAAMNIMTVFHLLLAGLGMYLLGHYLFKNRNAALISSVIFMLSSPNLFRAPFWRYGVAYIPLVVYFLFKIFKSGKQWIKYAVITSIMLSLQFLAGGVFIFYYTFLFLVATYLLYKVLISKKKLNVFVTVVMVSIILILVLLGFSLVRLMPSIEWSNQINRASGLSVSESQGSTLPISSAFTIFATGYSRGYGRIGWIAGILALLSLGYFYKTKNNYVLFFFLVMIGTIIFATGAFYPLWYKIIPGLSKQRHINRSLFVYVFCGAVLAGYGFLFLLSKMKKSKFFTKVNGGIKKLSQKKFFIVLTLILVFIIVDMLVFSTFRELYNEKMPQEDYRISIENNNLANYLSKDDDYFRTKVYEVRGIDWTELEIAGIPLGLEMTSHGFGGFWFNEYLHGFMGLAYQGDYAKINGVINAKYVTASKEINVSGLELIKVLKEDPTIDPDFIDGPYLYNNTKSLPRTFVPGSKVLILGEYEAALNLMRGVLLQDSFDTFKAVVVQGDKSLINSYDLNFLNNFDVILLTQGSIDQNSRNIAQRYVDSGGIVLPNLLEGKESFTLEDLNSIFSKFDSSISEVEIKEYNQNSVVIDVSSLNSDMLVMSERYSLFPQWKAYVDGVETKIYKTDVIISSILLKEGAKEVKFIYRPKSFVIGLWLFFITLFLVIGYFVYIYFKSK